ncbi:MAG: hypothetical protein VKN15_05765 [Cyanobacteriota bacterium]|nr:hypothetical protein [Cyanobacteriota bacterium]
MPCTWPSPLVLLQVGDRHTSSRSFSLNEASVLAAFATVIGSTVFADGAAHSDGLTHVRSLGTNLSGLEDIGGGDQDVDDHATGFQITQMI